MTPLELRVKNFMSYRDEACLDFERLSVTCFSGDNGAGKSALLDAITWAVWGKSRASSDRDLIAIGATEMEVTFSFGLADREYRVFRRRSGTGAARQSLEFAVREPGAFDWLEITGDNVRHTEKKIVETLNLDYETFVNSAFIMQGQADSFSQIGPTDRKRILAEILNLGEYDDLNQLAREDERTLRSQLDQANGRLASLESRVAERPSRLAELEALSRQLTDTGELLDLATELARSLAAQLAAWKQIDEALGQARSRLERAIRERSRIDAEISSYQIQQQDRARLFEQAADIEAGFAAYTKWRGEAARLSEMLVLVRRHETDRDIARRAIEREAAELRRALDQHEARGKQLREAIERDSVESASLTQLALDERAASERLERLPSIQDEAQSLRDERAQLQATNNELRARMNEIKENRDRIATGTALCPVCRAPLTPADCERIAAEWTAEGTALGDRFRDNKVRIDVLETSDRRLAAEEVELREVERLHARLLAQIDQCRQAEVRRSSAEHELAQLQLVISPLADRLARDDYALEHRPKAADASSALAALAYSQEAHEQAMAMERSNAHWEDRRRDLERAQVEFDSMSQQIEILNAQRAQYHEAAGEAQAEVERYEAQLREQPDLQRRAETAIDERDRLDALKNNLQSEFGGAQRALEELDRLASERDELAETVRVLGLDAGAVRELVNAFGGNGIQAMIVEGVLPEIEEDANDILRRMSSGSLRVALRSQREAVSVDRMIETLDILIRDEFGERPYALYSGGEAFRINFAVRIALSKLLARRAGSNIDILVIDEGFGSQDSRGRDGLLEALRSVEPDFGTIIVITHLNEIRDLFPTRVEIVKTESGSRIAIVDT
jgi:exonuclease SbcC